MKGVILAGGRGSRLYPLTHSICKQLLPVYDKPMIYYPLWVLMLAEIREILIIVRSCDLALFKNLLKDGAHLGLRIEYKVQHDPLGIAHALILAEDFLQNSRCALVLGDNIFHGKNLVSCLARAKQMKKGARIFTYPSTNAKRYGVVAFTKKGEIKEIVEKPETPPSNQVVTGLYFYDNKAVSLAKTLKPSKRGELEITDLNNCYLKLQELDYEEFGIDFTWMDSGTFESLYEASSYIRMVQKMHNSKVGCIDSCAKEKGYLLDLEQKQLLKV